MENNPKIARPLNFTDECQLTLRLLEMLEKTNYEMIQENGQRRLTAPEIIRGEKQRTKGAEIFLGRLPRDCYEDELMPALAKVGRLMELRLMLDFSGSTRGYAFALFEDSITAKRACLLLNGCEIRPGHRIGVVKSVNNCRLFFGGVPKNKSKSEFLQELNKILEGIVDVYLYPSVHDRTLNRGFIFVEFKDHRAAAMARRKLIPGKVVLWEHEIAVDWADPEPGEPVDDEIMETVTALFVRNLSLDMPQHRLREIFNKNTNIPILKLKKINHFAFIHYQNRRDAQTVMDMMLKANGIAEREGWEIRWAKPIGVTKTLERQRCINEAIAKTVTHKLDETHGRQATAKKNCVKTVEPCTKSGRVNTGSVHADALQRFVKEKLNAMCSFECTRMTDAHGFVCNINVFKEQNILFEYHGEPMPTRNKAIDAAAINMYYHLTTVQKQVPQPIDPYHVEQNVRISPAFVSSTPRQREVIHKF